MSVSPGRWAGTWEPSAWRRVPGSSGVLPGLVTGPPPSPRRVGLDGRRGRTGQLGLAACVPGGLLVVQELDGQLVVGAGVLEAELAGQAGLVRAVGAHPGAVAFRFGG